MKKYISFFVLILLLASAENIQAQKRKKLRKGKNEKDLFVPQKATKKPRDRSVNPIRKAFNMFNISFETGTGFFDYNQEFTSMIIVNPAGLGNRSYIYPSGTNTTGPFEAHSNWFSALQPITVNQINDDDIVLNPAAQALTLNNKGTFNPTTLKVTLSLKKIDKIHLKTTGEKRKLDGDLLRFGAGISFGNIKYRDSFLSTKDGDIAGTVSWPLTQTSQSKLFGTLSFNAWSYDDLSLFVDLEAGTWKFKSADFNTEVVKYNPFYSVGLTFQKRFSKYFKVYVKPAIEFRDYNWTTEALSIPNKFSMFSISLGFLIKYPTYPRNRFNGHRVQMEHVFQGKIYRGRSMFRRQNPRIGQNFRKQKNR